MNKEFCIYMDRQAESNYSEIATHFYLDIEFLRLSDFQITNSTAN